MTNYPEKVVSTYQLPDGINITLRPVRPEDADMIQEFVRHLSSQTKHTHFQENFRELSSEILKRLTHIDYDREMVLIVTHIHNEKETMIGMAQYAATLNPEECEAIIVVADEWHSKGIATRLMNRLIEVAKEKALKKITATIPAINADDLAFARSLGFVISNSDDPTIKIATMQL
jgi:acetyltransferase